MPTHGLTKPPRAWPKSPVGPPATAPSTRCARFCLTTSPSPRNSSPGAARRPGSPIARRSSKVSSPRRGPALLETWARSSAPRRRPAPPHRRRVRPRAGAPAHHGRAPFLPQRRCAVGQPRHPVDGRRHRQSDSVAGVVRICARYGNLSILEDAYGINLRPLATFAADAYANDPCTAFALKGPRAFRGRDAPHREDPEGHGRHPVQGRRRSLPEPLVRPGRPQPSAPDRPRARNGHGGRRRIRASGHDLPHGRLGRPLPPHRGRGRCHRAAVRSIHRQRAPAAPHALFPGSGQPVQDRERQPHAARLRAPGRRRIASGSDPVRQDLPGSRPLRHGGRLGARSVLSHRRGRAQARARHAVVPVARPRLSPVRQEQDGNLRAAPHRRQSSPQRGEEPVLLAAR